MHRLRTSISRANCLYSVDLHVFEEKFRQVECDWCSQPTYWIVAVSVHSVPLWRRVVDERVVLEEIVEALVNDVLLVGVV